MNWRRVFRPVPLLVAGLIALIVAVVILLNTSSNEYLLVPDTAHPLAQLVKVPGAKPADQRGGIYYVDVLERKASLLERLFPSLRDGATRYDVKIRENGVRVALVYGQTHAAGKLRPDDVIIAADRKPVRSTIDLHEILARHKVGDVVPITFLRKGVKHRVEITTSADPFDPTRAVIGFQPQPALDLHVPFQIKFNLGDVGGPSAGLAFALEILEKRGRDLDHGNRVAATGVIAPDGTIGPIGGVKQKVIGARQAHVDVFLVPAGDNYLEARKYAHGLRVVPVKTFQQALRVLATLPHKS
ncbi:MAG: PDZ domain-containing protein [Actinobacteria bacterium]|nr:MAG: PDZ domain-containing protein [Actinomycetota bacterium]